MTGRFEARLAPSSGVGNANNVQLGKGAVDANGWRETGLLRPDRGIVFPSSPAAFALAGPRRGPFPQSGCIRAVSLPWLRIPTEVARDSGMISPGIPI